MRKGDWEAFKSFFLDGDSTGDIDVLERCHKTRKQLREILGINYNEERIKKIEALKDHECMRDDLLNDIVDRLNKLEIKNKPYNLRINKKSKPEFVDKDDKYTILQQTNVELQYTLELKERVIIDLKQELIGDFVANLEDLCDKRPLQIKKEDIEKFVREVYELKEKWKKEGK